MVLQIFLNKSFKVKNICVYFFLLTDFYILNIMQLCIYMYILMQTIFSHFL